MNSKFKMIAIAVAAVSFMVGCNKKSDDAGVAQAQPMPTTCIVGQMPPAGYICQNGQLIPSAVGGTSLANLNFESTYMTGNLQINAQGPVNGPIYPGQSSLANYSGPVIFGGVMQASNTICYNGAAPAGSYTIQGSGTAYYGVITNATINFIGPAQLTLQSATVIPVQDVGVGIAGNLIMNGSTNCGWIQTKQP